MDVLQFKEIPSNSKYSDSPQTLGPSVEGLVLEVSEGNT